MEIQKIHNPISSDAISTNSISSELRASQQKSSQMAQADVTAHAPKQASISQDWQLLEKSQLALQALDDVDTDKVNALREAIKNGDFNLDLAQIADKMIKQHG